MRVFFFGLVISFLILFIINLSWIISTIYFAAIYGLQFVLHHKNLLESVDTSIYVKWILSADCIWIILALIFALTRKKYKTDLDLHYLQYDPLTNPSICIILPAHNEEASIEKIIQNYAAQKNVKYIIVIDDNSTDNTYNIAERCGARVIRKKENQGFAHTCFMGLREALKTDANIIATSESDGTYNAYDLSKMLPYLDNSDMVIGTRQVQILTEKGNQNSIIHVWGNLLVAKLIQLKYFNLLHIGIINLTDVGCMHRLIKRKSLEKIINKLTHPDTDRPLAGDSIFLHLTMLAVENDIRIVEVPVTFNRRIGVSKLESNKKLKGIKFGLKFLWFVLIS